MRGFPSAAALLLAVSGAIPAMAVSCGNVTIASASDADAVRADCATITGDLTFAAGLNETVSLDGVETILGDMRHEGCDDDEDDCVIPAAFSIASATLTTLNGTLDFWFFNGLAELRFPNLTLVQGTVSLKRLHELTLLDLTSLARVGSLVIEARSLTTLRHTQLLGFTDSAAAGSVDFWAAAVDSVDSFYSAPLELPLAAASSLQISSTNLPNVRSVTIGWARVYSLAIAGGNTTSIAVTLGAENTTTVDIPYLQLVGNIASFTRGPAVQNLTVGRFSFEQSLSTTALDLPFDQVTDINLSALNSLQNLTLPAQAVGWSNTSFSMYRCPDLVFDSLFHTLDNGSQEQTWYWPQGDIQSIVMAGVDLSNTFFDTLVTSINASTTRVLSEFVLSPSNAHVFDCTPFDDLHNRSLLPDDYLCVTVTGAEAGSHGLSGLATLHKSLLFGVAVLAMAACM